MEATIALGILIGLDNFRFGLGLGTLELSSRRRWQLAASFGLFEALMPLAGAVAGPVLAGSAVAFVQWSVPVMFATAGFLVLFSGLWDLDLRRRLSGSSALFFVPFALSIDNLVAGAAISVTEVPLIVSLALVGLLSATLASAGQFFGAVLTRYLPLRGSLVAGTALLVLSATSLVELL
jgi:putative Mn2+ efflux pump MntP